MAINVEDYVGIGVDPSTGRRHEIKYLPKKAEWEENVYQLEQRDKVLGGIDGIDNVQAQALANRTEYLKQQADRQAEDLEFIKTEGLGGTLTTVLEISIPATGWAETSGAFPFYLDIPTESVTAEMIPMMTILPASMEEAAACGICPTCETSNGAVRVYTKNVPATPIAASLTLLASKGGGSGGGGGSFNVAVATRSTAGIVKIGDGLSIDSEGTISVDKEATMTVDDLVDEEETKEDIARILQR